MKLITRFPITAIGSLPFTDEKDAVSLILSKFCEVPFWPQLPKRSFLEHMYAQYSENLPGVVINEKEKTIYVNTSGIDHEIEKALSEYIDFNVNYFGMTKEYASGLFEFIGQSAQFDKSGWKFVKGHITGPVSFGLTVTDENKRALYYNKTYKELLVKFLAMKAIWQIRILKKIFPKVIIFIDEPYLVSIGSSYVNIKEEEVSQDINEIVDAIHGEGALAGIHCCGNTNWGLLLKTKLDIINFDAYNFIDSISLYPEELKKFLSNSGILAFGLVPSQIEVLENTDIDKLTAVFANFIDVISKKGISKDKIINSGFLTPSCGLGSQPDGSVGRIFEALFELKDKITRI